MKYTALAIGFALIPVASWAQPANSGGWTGSGGWGADSPINKLYNPETVITFNGKVYGKSETEPSGPNSVGATALLVKTKNGGTSRVHLGPVWYMENQKQQIALGDNITVTGSKIALNGVTQVLAQKVVKNDKVMYLRGLDGFPMWVAFRGTVAVQSNRPTTENILNMTGRVVDTITIQNGQDGVPSSALVIENPDGVRYTVDLGPQWFIRRQDTQFLIGDNIIVTYVENFRPAGAGNVLIANGVARGEQKLVLRMENGRPVWRIIE